jgi:folate/biopterin transporter
MNAENLSRWCLPFREASAFVSLLIDAFSGRFVLFLAITYFSLKGYAFRALTTVELPYLKNYLQCSGDEYQKYYNISMMGFSIKPLIGIVSDNFPILGYHKRWYMLLFCMIGAAVTAGVTQLPSEKSSGATAAVLLFAAVLGISSLDLLCEGKYSEIMVNRKDTGSSVISWIWGWYMLGGVGAAVIEGPLADSRDPRIVLWTVVPMYLLPVAPIILGWVPEEPSATVGPMSRRSLSDVDTASLLRGTADECPSGSRGPSGYGAAFAPTSLRDTPVDYIDEQSAAPQVERAQGWIAMTPQEQRGVVILGILASTAAVGTLLASLFASDILLMVYIAFVSSALFCVCFAILPRAVAVVNLFVFAKELCYLQINGPLDYFYTADAACLPNGPAFSFTYYQTFGSIAANAAGILAVILFQRFLSDFRFRSIFWLTTFIKIFASFFDVVIVLRWNVDVLGIDDKVAYMCGDAIIYQMSTMLDFIPASVLISRTCPKGMECTVFALLAGFSNFGQNLSRCIGAALATWMNIRTTVPCNFDNLYLLIGIGHMLMPLLILPLSVLLISNEPMTDRANDPEEPPSRPSSPASRKTPTAVMLRKSLLLFGAPDATDEQRVGNTLALRASMSNAVR